MTYQEIIKLKFDEGVGTQELMRRFPDETERVSEVALLDLSDETLKEVVQEEKTISRLMKLKKKFLGS